MSTKYFPSDLIVFIQELNTITTSEIKTDDLSLGLYATDASLYQLQPLAVAIPSNESDLIKIVQIANKIQILR